MDKNEEKEFWKEIEKEDRKRAYYLQKSKEANKRINGGILLVIFILLIIGTIIMIITGDY